MATVDKQGMVKTIVMYPTCPVGNGLVCLQLVGLKGVRDGFQYNVNGPGPWEM